LAGAAELIDMLKNPIAPTISAVRKIIRIAFPFSAAPKGYSKTERRLGDFVLS